MEETKLLIEELQAIRGLQDNIHDWTERSAKLTAAASRTTTQLSLTGGSGGGSQDKMGDAVAALVDLNAQLLQKVVECQVRILSVEEIVDKQKANFRRVLRLRYLEGLEWEEVGVLMHYTDRWCRKIHELALEEIKGITIKLPFNSSKNRLEYETEKAACSADRLGG